MFVYLSLCFPEQKYLKLKLEFSCVVWSVDQTAESQLPKADLQSKLFKPGWSRIIPSVVSCSRSSLLASIRKTGKRKAWRKARTAYKACILRLNRQKTDPRDFDKRLAPSFTVRGFRETGPRAPFLEAPGITGPVKAGVHLKAVLTSAGLYRGWVQSQYKQLSRTKKLQHRDNKIDANLLKKQEVILKELKYKKTTLSQLNSLDKPFSEEEVKQSIKRLKNKKAAGLDRIRNEMLKSGAHYLTGCLTK